MGTQVNADPSELAKFSDLAHRWWDQTGEFGPLHTINPVRLKWIQSHTSLLNQKVLDVGCGGGILCESLARAGASVTGIDLSTKALRIARLHALESELTGIRFLEISAEELAQKEPQQYDVVTCMEMLEHVPDPASVVAACAQLVKPGGVLFFSTIHRNAKAFAQAIVAAEYIMNLIPKGTHEYAKLIRPSELARLCRDAGLSVECIRGIDFSPMTRRAQLTSDTSVNYLLKATRGAEHDAL